MIDKGSSENVREAETIARAKQGDREATVRLFGEHLATVQRFAMRMCRDEEKARDVAQESLLTALKSLQDYRGEASFSTWLFTIARSHCGRLRRRADREPIGEGADAGLARLTSSEPTADAQVSHGEISDALERGLGALDPSEREVILLRDVEGITASEAARILQISVPALKSRLHRARCALRENVRASVDAAPEPADPRCPDVVAAFSAKLEGDLPANACATLEAHVAECPSCTSRCESIRRLVGACGALRQRPESPELRIMLEQIVASFQKAPGAR